MRIRKLSAAQTEQLFPTDEIKTVEPANYECSVRCGDHYWIRIQSYLEHRYWPENAYLSFCSYCTKLKE